MEVYVCNWSELLSDTNAYLKDFIIGNDIQNKEHLSEFN